MKYLNWHERKWKQLLSTANILEIIEKWNTHCIVELFNPYKSQEFNINSKTLGSKKSEVLILNPDLPFSIFNGNFCKI